MKLKICIGSDHAGYEAKQKIKEWLQAQSNIVLDWGTHSNKQVDYPVFAHQVAKSIQNNECDFGILVCGSGQGMSITANKYQMVRAALCWDKKIAILAREHNNANILVLPGRFLSEDAAIEISEAFISTDFVGGRHQKRLDLIDFCSAQSN